jgi:hypothetical protein
MRTFKAPWSNVLWIVSAVTTAILLGVAAIPAPGLGWIRLMPLVILAGALPFVVRSYTIGADALLIRRLFWDTRIALAGLRSVRFDPAAVCGSIRTCGNGGLFSFTGWYWNRTLKSYRAFATDPKRVVVLTFDTRRIVVTPERPEEFVRELSACCQT